MATVQCSKCTAERKGFRRELDSWRHKLIHCVGFESILEGICGQMLLGDLKLHDGCQPEEVDDWIPAASVTLCSFCNLPLDKLADQAPSSTSPLSSPSDYSPCQAPAISDSHQSAHRFLQAVFHKKDVHVGCDSSVPLVAQELMKKMIRQFALEYASKCLLNTSTNGVTTRTSSPLPEKADAPLDLTVGRTREKEDAQSEPDTVLDLSNRNSATSSTFSSTQKASGCLLPLPAEERGQPERGRRQTTALDAVLSSLCPPHRSLLHRVLKLAHQERLLSFLSGRHAAQRCHCGADAEERALAPFRKSKGCCACGCPGHGTPSRLHPLRDCNAPPASGCCCRRRLQAPGVEAYAVLCPKRLHIFSCPGLAVCSSNNFCPLASASQPAPLCGFYPPPGTLHACHCCLNLFNGDESATEQGVGDVDPTCPVLRREQSPSPPPLSPIPSDVGKKCEEKPPSLLPHRRGDDGGSDPGRQEAEACVEAKREPERRPPADGHGEQNPSATILQDVMNRFSEKLETIRPAEKDPCVDPAAVRVSENEPPPSPSTSQRGPFHGDAHLTEIITTVLHAGSASDYNLNELFNHHDSKGQRSPNTRARRRQEVLAAMATPAHDASSRRHTLQIKRELAMLEQSCPRRKAPAQKRAKLTDVSNVSMAPADAPSDSEGPKQETDAEPEPAKSNEGGDGPPEFLLAEYGKDEIKEEIKAVVITEEVLRGKLENEELMIWSEETQAAASGTPTLGPELQSTFENKGLNEDSTSAKRRRPVGRPRKSDLRHGDGTDLESPSGLKGDGNSKDARRSRRTIVPPQRFSSFVTESRKMYFVACFSENVFNKGAQTDTDLFQEPDDDGTSSKPTGENVGSTSAERPLESTREECGRSPCEASQSPSSVKDTTGGPEGTGCGPVLGRLRSTSKRLQDSEASTNALHFTSPIKRMFVSPLKDEEGVRYSLKAAGPGPGGLPEEPFDPCQESSWSGTPQKPQSRATVTSASPKTPPPSKSASPPLKARPSPPTRSSPSKSSPSPAKHASAALRSASSPRKSPSSPAKSLRSASSSPRLSPRRSGEGTPTKPACDAPPPIESAPPKRRPGRPKKPRPQPEQKVKRPIGRPRKQRDGDPATGGKGSNGNRAKAADGEENANKNLKITVVYGRSRRNKRTVSEGFDQLQTEFRDACQAAGLKSDLGILTHGAGVASGGAKPPEAAPPEMLSFISPPKESAAQSGSNIKCQKREDPAPARKPGRPAKVKISGISVTVTTVSPRQRKIQMRKNARLSPKTLIRPKVRSPDFKTAKGPLTIRRKSAGKISPAEAEDRGEDGTAVRHSARVRKPSAHFLHAVATSAYRSYSRSNALLRRSRQLLLSKVSSERKQAEHAAEERGRRPIAEELSRVGGVSVDSIFSPREAPRWWAASAEEKSMNRELARRIRLISDTWVSDMAGNQEKEAARSKAGGERDGKAAPPSVVRALFDCSPNRPRSCSMQQLCSWFMKTTETRSLAIVKKASSRNPYEVMHFPRTGGRKRACHSPQTERLRKHIKKFAKIVPKSPQEHRLMRRRMRTESPPPTKRRLFPPDAAEGEGGARWRRKEVLSRYQATLCRARTRFLNRRDRKSWRSQRKRVAKKQPAAGSKPKRGAVRTSKHHGHVESRCATGGVPERGHPVDVPKEQNLCCKAWSPESLKECRVFLRKINSPDSESAEEEWDSCTVTLDDGSGRRRELAQVVKAVKTERRTGTGRASPRERAGSASGAAQERSESPRGRRKGKNKVPGAGSAEAPQPPPAKLLRQSRVRGLTGPRWCDFVLEK